MDSSTPARHIPSRIPNGLTHQLELDLQLVIHFAVTITFGRMLGRVRQGIVLAGAMTVILLGSTVISVAQEQGGNPALTRTGVTLRAATWRARTSGSAPS